MARGDVMIKVKGKTFYCPNCGANVFKPVPDKPDTYSCNGCDAWFTEREEGEDDRLQA